MKVSVFLITVTLSASTLLTPLNAMAEAWNPMNNPKGFFSDWYKEQHPTELEFLPLSGEVSKEYKPWADSYWPKNRGAFTYRWFEFQQDYSKGKIPQGQDLTTEDRQRLFFNYRLFSKQEIINMKPEQLKRLSPLEKYSIVIKDFDFNLVKKFRDRNSSSDEYWEGYCHAWSAASANYPEPLPVEVSVVVDGKKVTVPFGSGDVKALLTAHYAELDGWSSLSGKWNKFKRVFNRNAAPKLNIRYVGNICQNTFYYPTTKMKKGSNDERISDYVDFEKIAKDLKDNDPEVASDPDRYLLRGSDGESISLKDAALEKMVTQYQENVNRILGDRDLMTLTQQEKNHLNLAKNRNLAAEARSKANDPSCNDTNAGAFHIVMSNQIGRRSKNFLLDKTRDAEIWNQPAYKYESKIIRDFPKEQFEPEQIRNAAPGTVRMVEVDTRLYYADDTDYGWTFWNPTLANLFGLKDYISKFMEEYRQYQAMLIKEGDLDQEEEYPAHLDDHAHYRYLLELDRNGAIIGGQWISLERPDDLYLVDFADFGDEFRALGRIYHPIIETKEIKELKRRANQGLGSLSQEPEGVSLPLEDATIRLESPVKP